MSVFTRHRQECLCYEIKNQKMTFIEELRWRGLIQDVTPELEEAEKNGKLTAYIGFDPTAESLHIGNMVPIMLLVHWQRHGHKPIALVGGATGRIGDPSGKDAERQLLDLDVLDRNVEKIEQQLSSFLDFDCGDASAQMVNNYDFYKDMGALEFLRDVGKHMTVNYLMSKDSVKNRLESGLSFTEFSYQLIQGYDFKCLYEKYNCTLQMGGSDQWGNITAGVEFIRRMLSKKSHALTTPLLTKPNGQKYGKSEGGNVWLDAKMTSPYQFYQFWLGSEDAMLDRLFKTFSLKTQSEIEAILTKHAEDLGQRSAQKILAEEITVRVHSQEAYEAAVQASDFLFRGKREALLALSEKNLEVVSDEVTKFAVSKSDLDAGIGIIALMAETTTIVGSRSEAQRAIKGNAVSVNKKKVTDKELIVNASHLLHERFIMVENGKKNKFIIEVT